MANQKSKKLIFASYFLSFLLLTLLIPLQFFSDSVKADVYGDWGNWYPSGISEDATNLTGADIRLKPDGYEYIGLWEMYPNSGEEPWEDIDDTGMWDTVEPWADTGDNFLYMASGDYLRQCTFTFPNIAEFGTGYYQILVHIIVLSIQPADWWVRAGSEWSDKFTTSQYNAYLEFWLEFPVDIYTGNSWTVEKINSLRVSILLDGSVASPPAMAHKITELSVLVRDTDAPSPGVLIMRPDSDGPETMHGGSPNFDRWPTSSPNNYSLLDETTAGSDYLSTFVTANVTADLQQGIYGLTDLTDRPLGEAYSVKLWVMAKATKLSSWGIDAIRMDIGLRGSPSLAIIAQEEHTLSTAWMNYTMDCPVNPVTGGTWTKGQLDNMLASITVYNALISDTAIQISQIAVMVYIAEYIPSFFGEDAEQQIQFYNMIWLLIIFLPALALCQVAPQIGFAGGMIIMLLIFGIILPGFISVTIIGLIAIGVMMYKGD